MPEPITYRVSRYRCSGCQLLFALDGDHPGTHLSWTEPEVDLDTGPTGEGILEDGYYCPACRAEIEAKAGQVESFVG